MESIDELIENNRKKIIEGSGLGMVDDLSAEFLRLVKNESQHLRIHGRINYYLRFRKVFTDVRWKIKNGLKRMIIRTDALLSNLRIYKNIIRPGLKKAYLYFKPQKKIYIRRLYKLNDEEFIKELYRVFLNREADPEGFRHNLNILQSNECDRLDMIYIFNNSSEGDRTPAKIIGKFLLRRKKSSCK